MYLRFILRSREPLDRIKKYLAELQQSSPELKCISANIQPVPHAILEGEEEIILTTLDHIRYLVGDVTINLRPRAFVQTNEKVAQKLYQTAAEWVREIGTGNFTELFCGQGAFSFACAPFVKKALGVEINEEAVATAKHTAHMAGLTHLRFIASDAGSVENVVKEFHPDVLLVNPPRRGLGSALDLVAKSQARHLIYSSCSHETLAEDVRKLDGYEVVKAQIFDMFPHTSHFETLVLLQKR
jgi:23S rRNA (uracil747-C5)-methyltransferase